MTDDQKRKYKVDRRNYAETRELNEEAAHRRKAKLQTALDVARCALRNTEMTLVELRRRFGVSESFIRNYFARYGIKREGGVSGSNGGKWACERKPEDLKLLSDEGKK